MAIADGVYEIRFALDTSTALDIPSASKEKGANVQLYSVNHSNAQVFYIDRDDVYGEGEYTIRNVYSGLFFGVASSVAQDKQNVIQWTETGSRGQHWRIVETGETVVVDGVICPVVNIPSCVTQDRDSFYLDVYAAKTENKTNVQIYHKNGTNAQVFVLYPTTKQDSTLPVPTILGWADHVGDDDYYYYHGPADTLYPVWQGTQSWSSVTTNGWEGCWRERLQDYDTGTWGEWSEQTAWADLATTRDGTTFWLTSGIPATLPSDAKCRRYEFQVRAFAGSGENRARGLESWTNLEVLTVPDVTLSDAGFGVYGLRIPYTSDYTGGTTNVCIESITCDGEEMLAEPYKWYTGLDVSGTLYVPIESMTGWVDDGATIDVAYKVGNDQRLSYAERYTDALDVSYNAGTIEPTLSAADGRTLKVEVEADVVHVWWRYDGVMREAKVKDGVAYVTYPFGPFELFVSSMNGDVSDEDWGLAHLTLAAGTGVLANQPPCHVWSWDGGTFLLECDTDPLQTDRTIEPLYEVMALNSREHQSVYFQGPIASEFSAVGLLFEGVTESPRESMLELAKARHVTYRAPSGEVADVAVVGVNYQTHREYTKVEVTMIEETR